MSGSASTDAVVVLVTAPTPEQRLLVLLDLALPAVDRPEPGHDVPARGEALGDEGAGDLGGALGRRRGDEDDDGVGGGGLAHGCTVHIPDPLEMISFMISDVPPAMVITRMSRQARAMPVSST